jgi:hypothetical protein
VPSQQIADAPGRPTVNRSKTAMIALLVLAAMSSTWNGSANATVAESFEQDQRVNSLTLQTGTDAFATQNAFGAAFHSVALTSLQDGLDASVADGTISWLLAMPGLTDLTGTNDPAFDVGIVNGVPRTPAGNPTSYDGTSDLDWWYDADAGDVDETGAPIHTLSGSFTAGTFDAGPGAITLRGNLLGAASSLAMSSVRIRATSGSSSAPLESTIGFPPGHLPEEAIPDPLVSFGSMTSGQLAGDISAGSLAATPMPAGMQGSACAQSYTAANTMLDMMVGGCTYLGFLTMVSATQPDRTDPPGAGSYAFTTDVNHHIISCTHNAVPTTLDECYATAAYSVSFHFTTDRVILRHPCAPGSYSTDGTGPCTLADAGYFVDGYGATSQTACPEGMTSTTGASSCDLLVTTTAVGCAENPVPIGVTTLCTATVEDQISGPVPTGDVTWTRPAGAGEFSLNPCTLASPGTGAICSVSYTPASGSAGNQQLGAAYAGDGDHSGSTGEFVLMVVKRATATTARCKPKIVVHGGSTVCTATVADTSGGTPSAPTGKVRWSALSTFGTFSSTSCTLVTGSGERTCKVTFTTRRSIRGRIELKATYLGDANHRRSSGVARLRVT